MLHANLVLTLKQFLRLWQQETLCNSFERQCILHSALTVFDGKKVLAANPGRVLLQAFFRAFCLPSTKDVRIDVAALVNAEPETIFNSFLLLSRLVSAGQRKVDEDGGI